MEGYNSLLLGQGLFAAALFMVVLYARQRRTQDATPVDIGWAIGIGLVSVYLIWNGQGDFNRRLIVGALVSVWALRLSWHLYARRSSAEDGRYAMLRQQWGDRAQRNFLLLYLAQAPLIAFFSIPSLLAAANPHPLSMLDGLGVAIWLMGIGGESVADAQLHRFRSQPANAGRTCSQGLWKYSRHPNYFFEWLHWFAYVAWALPYDWGWLSLMAPVIMLYLLFSVTGIPYTEKRALLSRGDEYRTYQERTNAFFPFFHKTAHTKGTSAKEVKR